MRGVGIHAQCRLGVGCGGNVCTGGIGRLFLPSVFRGLNFHCRGRSRHIGACRVLGGRRRTSRRGCFLSAAPNLRLRPLGIFATCRCASKAMLCFILLPFLDPRHGPTRAFLLFRGLAILLLSCQEWLHRLLLRLILLHRLCLHGLALDGATSFYWIAGGIGLRWLLRCWFGLIDVHGGNLGLLRDPRPGCTRIALSAWVPSAWVFRSTAIHIHGTRILAERVHSRL
mmetsp:Transcript_22638/g.65847  ORF Transcript_22638/g.65847 Transcript_22638/m.65847 type:complete len:227 (-) Transcript_22638:3654-4334(-)